MTVGVTCHLAHDSIHDIRRHMTDSILTIYIYETSSLVWCICEVFCLCMSQRGQSSWMILERSLVGEDLMLASLVYHRTLSRWSGSGTRNVITSSMQPLRDGMCWNMSLFNTWNRTNLYSNTSDLLMWYRIFTLLLATCKYDVGFRQFL